jgi:ribose/xylose/arabinose/galactoside ABC-type transport system permease subunit
MLGRQIYALGGSAEAAKRIGINITKILVFVYLYMGLMVGIGTYVHMSLVAQVEPNMFDGFEMQVIAAVVVGGASMAGGSGTISGTVIGVVFMSFLQNGLTLMRVSSYWHYAIVGLVMLLAVSVDIVQRRRMENRLQKIDVME